MKKTILIPREIIYEKNLCDKRVLLFSYLCVRRTIDNSVAFSISDVCSWLLRKPNRQIGKINETILNTFSAFETMNYFNSNADLRKITNISYYYLLKINEAKFDFCNNYSIIYLDELNLIRNYKIHLKNKSLDVDRITSSNILLVFSYIRVNINQDIDKPYCCYRLYQTISEDLGISERYIGKIIQILDDLKIIKTQEAPRSSYTDDKGKKCFRTSPKVFANYKKYIRKDNETIVDEFYDPQQEIENQIKLMQHKQKSNDE